MTRRRTEGPANHRPPPTTDRIATFSTDWGGPEANRGQDCDFLDQFPPAPTRGPKRAASLPAGFSPRPLGQPQNRSRKSRSCPGSPPKRANRSRKSRSRPQLQTDPAPIHRPRFVSPPKQRRQPAAFGASSPFVAWVLSIGGSAPARRAPIPRPLRRSPCPSQAPSLAVPSSPVPPSSPPAPSPPVSLWPRRPRRRAGPRGRGPRDPRTCLHRERLRLQHLRPAGRRVLHR